MRKLKPTSAGQRQTKIPSYRKVLTASKPHKPFTKGKKKISGRAASGRISVRHKGGGHKRRFREIDFTYAQHDVIGVIKSVEYDPNRSGFISLVSYQNGFRAYVLTPASLKPGDSFLVSEKARVKPGNRLPLRKIPVGVFVYNVEIHPGGGAKISRSAGNYAEVVANEAGKTSLKLPSGEVRKVSENSWASVGEVSNNEHKLRNLGKAGRSRWLGIRPTVRGSVMNPVDHPHGGGEGKQGIGLRLGPKTPWGKQALGVKTRKTKKYSNSAIVTRRKRKKRK
ncbi:MAG TPA: 50S ribosomal protein L2 [Candidatus Paceibacterota bacterium]|nr:50S ribosomal protein L2 [Candidatus Paceibacterota bacterium]